MSWAYAASCPPQYGLYETDACGRQTLVGCTKSGVVDVTFNGMSSWVRVWFNQGVADNAVSLQYSDAARLYMGEHTNPQFDLDYAAWMATQPPAQSPLLCPDGNG